ncbi:hypothetical protein, partial [Streptomyces sp. NPDC002559]
MDVRVDDQNFTYGTQVFNGHWDLPVHGTQEEKAGEHKAEFAAFNGDTFSDTVTCYYTILGPPDPPVFTSPAENATVKDPHQVITGTAVPGVEKVE